VPPAVDQSADRPATAPAARTPEHREPPPSTAPPVDSTETRPAASPPQAPAPKPAETSTAPPVPPAPKPTLTSPAPSAPPASAVDYVPPQAIRQTQPIVPGNLRALITRDVLVEVILSIDANGNIEKAQPSSTQGTLNNSLARLAVDAARLWKFRPARQGDKPVPGEVRIQFRFGPGR
jgi:periplasmic protein TonB